MVEYVADLLTGFRSFGVKLLSHGINVKLLNAMYLKWWSKSLCERLKQDLTTFFITVTSPWAPWRLKSPASRLFAQQFVQAHTKGTSKLRGFRPQRVSNAENVSISLRHHFMWYRCTTGRSFSCVACPLPNSLDEFHGWRIVRNITQ